MLLPATQCQLFTRRQLSRWHDADHLGIAACGVVGRIGRTLWYDPERLEAWVRNHSTRRPVVALPAGMDVPRIAVHPRKRNQASVAALA